jgi:hypothetical protein
VSLTQTGVDCVSFVPDGVLLVTEASIGIVDVEPVSGSEHKE